MFTNSKCVQVSTEYLGSFYSTASGTHLPIARDGLPLSTPLQRLRCTSYTCLTVRKYLQPIRKVVRLPVVGTYLLNV